MNTWDAYEKIEINPILSGIKKKEQTCNSAVTKLLLLIKQPILDKQKMLYKPTNHPPWSIIRIDQAETHIPCEGKIFLFKSSFSK